MPPRLLVVDDDAAARRFIGDVLLASGYEVEFAGDGRDALQKCRECAFDLIISDQRMPGATGEQIALVVSRTQGTPVILLTGAPVAREFPLPEGVSHLLSKPITPAALVAAADQALRMKGRAAAERQPE
jgi:CheY-like chemotaxis protein